MRIAAHALTLAAAALLGACATVSLPEPGELAGPPAVTANGCSAEEAWTLPYLAKHFEVPERAVRRASRKYMMDATALCTQPIASVKMVLAKAGSQKPGYDEPDKAMEYRALSLRSDDGTITEGGLRAAFEQRQQVEASTEPKAGGLTPGVPFWTDIGPGTVGGRIRAVLPLSPTRILVGGVGGGLWLTENGGTSWTVVRDMMPSVAISCLVPDPADNSIIYACTGEGFFNGDAIRGDGVWKITGASGAPATWTIAQVPGTAAAAGTQWRYVNRLVVLPQAADPNNVNNRMIAAATNNGIYRSVNGGTSFTLVRTGRHLDLRYHPLDWNNLVAGNDAGGVSYSTDGGATWNAVATVGLPIGGAGRVEVHPVSIASPGPVWLASVYTDGGQLWRSTNAGQTWARRDVAGLSTSTTPAGGVLDQQGWYDNTLWSSPDGNRVIVGGVGIRLSVDGGLNFGVGTSPPANYSYGAGLPGIHVDHHAIVQGTDFATTGTVFFGNDGGLYKAANLHTVATPNPGSIMTNLNNGLGITQFYGGAGAGSGATLRISGGTQDNGTRTWNGTTWSLTFGGDGGESAVDPTNTQFVYGSIQNLGLFRSSNGGTSAAYICQGITEAACPPTGGTGKTNFIPPFTLDPNNSDRMLVGAQSVWRSNNVRTSSPSLPTWATIRAPQPSRFCLANPSNSFCLAPNDPNTYINFIAVAPGNPDIVWVGYNDGQLATTTNGTATTPTWTMNAYTGITAPNRLVTRILFDPSNLQRVWMAFGGYNTGNVIVTTNGGATWSDVHGNLPASPVRALVRHPAVANTIYAGTEVGVFASDSSGTTWSTINEGPGTVSVEELFFLDANTLYASTHGRGMFRATINLGSSPGVLQLAQTAVSVTEGASATLTVSRVGGTSGAASVSYATSGGTATAGADYTASTGTLNWAAGDAADKTVTVATATDALAEGAETFNFTISGATGATLGAPATATVTVTDPDTFPGTLPAAWYRPTTQPGTGTTDASIVATFVPATDSTFAGSQSLKAEPIGDSQKAAIELVVYTGAGNVSFARRVSSESGFDFLRFYIDGVQQSSWSGEVAWSTVTFPITAGMHTLRWVYEKDGSVVSGSDTAWIDSVVLPGTGLSPSTDTDVDGVPNGVEANEGLNPTVKDNDIFATTAKGNRLFAMQQYRDFLSREGDAGGIAFWVTQLSGPQTRAQAIQGFFTSPEFQGVIAPVARLYFAYFLRFPDYVGLQFHVARSRTGTPLATISNDFAASPEFVSRYGALTNDAFIELVYQNVLGRPSDPVGKAYWLAQMAGGATRGTVMLGFSDSPEYVAAIGNEVFVTMMYVGMLKRAPDTGGFSFWVSQMDGGTSGLNLTNGFLVAPEYRARFLP